MFSLYILLHIYKETGLRMRGHSGLANCKIIIFTFIKKEEQGD